MIQLSVDEAGEAFVRLPTGTVDGAAQRVRGRLQCLHDRRTRRVRLATLAELHVAGILELVPALPFERFTFELGEADAADGTRRSRQARVDDVAG